MKTRTLINRLIAFIAFMVVFTVFGYGLGPPDGPRAPQAVKALLLVDDLYGASINIEDNQNNIIENFRDYGWEVTLACCAQEANPCSWASMQGCEVITPDIRTYELDNVLEWDVIVVAPGVSHLNLMNCPFVMNILTQARAYNIPVAAWCRGVRVLAAADVIKGVEITGHADYEDEYLIAGATYLGSFEPPTEDQNIITCMNATEYRQDMCELIRNVVENNVTSSESSEMKIERIDLKLCPNPIKTSSEVTFSLEQPAVVHIAIFDQHGQMVMDVVKQQFPGGASAVTFYPSSLPTGIYYVYLFCNGRMGMQKCMII